MAYVYRFIDKDGKVIYYGKTVNINRRIADHFSKGHLPEECYKSVCRIEYQKYKTESDSLIMEQYFISKYAPRYNKQGQSRDTPTLKLDEGSFKVYRDMKPVRSSKVEKTSFFWKVIAGIYLIYVILYYFNAI